MGQFGFVGPWGHGLVGPEDLMLLMGYYSFCHARKTVVKVNKGVRYRYLSEGGVDDASRMMWAALLAGKTLKTETAKITVNRYRIPITAG